MIRRSRGDLWPPQDRGSGTSLVQEGDHALRDLVNLLIEREVARIEGDEIIVHCDKVKKPVAVRYAWADDPKATLENREGLQASPFRADLK